VQQEFRGIPNENIPISAPSGYAPPQNNLVEPQNEGGFEIGHQETKKKNNDYLTDWKKDMEEREMRKKREKEEERRKEREDMEKYSNPFGKAGAGAPVRNNKGKIITSRQEGVQESINQASHQNINYEPPKVSRPIQHAQQPPPQVQHQQPPPQVQYQQPPPQIQYQQPIQQRMPDQNFQNPNMVGGIQNMN